MVILHVGKGILQSQHVESAVKQECGRIVIGAASGMKLLEEPDPKLGGRDRMSGRLLACANPGKQCLFGGRQLRDAFVYGCGHVMTIESGL
jgi:hypothetical protein